MNSCKGKESFCNKPTGSLCLVKSQLGTICLEVYPAEPPCCGCGDSVENIDSGHPFLADKITDVFIKNCYAEVFQGVPGLPIKIPYLYIETACPLYRKFWMNELELCAYLSRKFFPYVRNTVFLPVCDSGLLTHFWGIILL